MKDEDKTKEQLISELAELRRRNAELEASTSRRRLTDAKPTNQAAASSEMNALSEEKNRVLNTFSEIGQAILSSSELGEMLGGLVEQIINTGIFRSLMIALVDAQEEQIEVVGSVVCHPDGITIKDNNGVIGTRYSLDDSNITAEVARTGEMRVIDEWSDKFDSRFSNPESRAGQVSYFIPIKRRGAILAVLATGSTIKEKEQTLQRIEAMQPLLQQVALFLDHARIYKALHESKQHLEFALMGASLGWRHYNIQTKVVTENRQFYGALGYSPDEAPRWDDIIHPDDKHEVGAQMIEHWESGTPFYEAEYRVQTRSGEWRWILDRGQVVEWDKDGQPLKAAGVHLDITERKRMEEELMKVQKLESVGVLAGGIAHDFNNILTGILGNISLAQMFVEMGKPAAEVLERLKEAERASIRASGLTQQLLTFSKGGVPIKRTASMTKLLRDSASMASSGSNIRCEFSISDDLWSVDMDEGQMNQVISNIVINANQSMPDGGTVKVHAGNTTVKAEHGLPLADGEYVEVSIEDHGVGIQEADLPKIFDPYFTTKQTGSGLGLAICYSILDKHGGYITADSQPGVGTTFRIYLPASPEEASVNEESRKEKPITGNGNILLMDDEEIVRELANNIMENLGYEVTVAVDGTETVELYRRAMESGDPFDAVITDLTIPGGMGGKETIKKLIEIDPEVKAIVSSGYSNDPIMTNFGEYGFNGVIAKPYKANELGEVLNKVITDVD